MTAVLQSPTRLVIFILNVVILLFFGIDVYLDLWVCNRFYADACFTADIPSPLEFQARRLTNCVFDLQTHSHLATSAEIHHRTSAESFNLLAKPIRKFLPFKFICFRCGDLSLQGRSCFRLSLSIAVVLLQLLTIWLSKIYVRANICTGQLRQTTRDQS